MQSSTKTSTKSIAIGNIEPKKTSQMAVTSSSSSSNIAVNKEILNIAIKNISAQSEQNVSRQASDASLLDQADLSFDILENDDFFDKNSEKLISIVSLLGIFLNWKV